MASWIYNNDSFKTIPFDWDNYTFSHEFKAWCKRNNITPVIYSDKAAFTHLVWHKRWNKCYWICACGITGEVINLKRG